jgi:hypothetical protein
MGLAQWAAFPGGKRLDQWLLVSEKNSFSIAHVDVCLATWVSCLAGGKKTFWLRNLRPRDKLVWNNFNIHSDHKHFTEPWARVDLTPGYIL